MIIKVRLQPKSGSNKVVDYINGILKVKVTAVPAKNKANDACIKVLSSFFRVPKSMISLVSGGKSKDKTFDLKGLDNSMFENKLTRLKN